MKKNLKYKIFDKRVVVLGRIIRSKCHMEIISIIGKNFPVDYSIEYILKEIIG